jgi:TPR repeat protein
MYLDGLLVPEDLVEAYKWFALGASQGDGVARHYMQEMDAKNLLSPGQKEEASRRVAEYQISLGIKPAPAIPADASTPAIVP